MVASVPEARGRARLWLAAPVAVSLLAAGLAAVGARRSFELEHDYYPAPTAGLVACDRGGRILAAGRGVFELTGFQEGDLLGQQVADVFGLAGFAEDRNPIALSLEWGVRRLNEHMTMRTRAGIEKPVVADVFPALDDDGGLLVALAPGSRSPK